jgi:hypothetical protein
LLPNFYQGQFVYLKNQSVMKKSGFSLLFIFLLTTMCFVNTTFSNQGKIVTDSAKKLFDISLAFNVLTKGLQDVSTFSIYNNNLYFINNNKLIEINLVDGRIGVNKIVSDFLKKLPSNKRFVSQVRVTTEGYYLTIFNDLYHVSTAGVVSRVYHSYRFFGDLYVAKDRLLVATMDSIEMISNEGRPLKVQKIPGFNYAGYRSSSEGICHQATEEDSIYEFKGIGNNIAINRYQPVSLNGKIKEPYISWVTDKYFLVYAYSKRDMIYAVKKGTKSDVYKTISLKRFNLTPSSTELQNEEGYPKFRIIYSNNVFYTLSLIKGKLRILSFSL